MTRRILSVAAAPATDKRDLMRPLRPARTLSGEVVARIADEIRSGRLEPGQRLPTEQELMTAMGVSRTVVREAVAALRADGLVTTRQGSGAFVAPDDGRIPFRIDPEGLSSIGDVLDVMELRLAVEIEAAALAAERATPERHAAIDRTLRAFDVALRRGEAAVSQDFDFHRAIAVASGNPRFVQFLEFLGRHVIPRQRIRVSLSSVEEQRRYLLRIQKEHDRIFDAIHSRQGAEARKAMRTHLTRSLERYRKLAERQIAAR